MTERTYYDVLGVAADAPDIVIKAAFRALAKEYHPDRAGGQAMDPEKFIEIQNAYAVLSNPESRSEYDARLRETSLFPYHFGQGENVFGGEAGVSPWPHVPAGAVEVERLYARLCLYSEALAQSFHEAFQRGECGEDPARHADRLEKEFFRQFFGEDNDIQALARLLLLRSRSGAALTLNQLVAGGVSSHSDDIRGILRQILEQHFSRDALFAEWLKVKFGIVQLTPPEQPKAVPRRVRPQEGAAAPGAVKPPKRPQPATVLRSFTTLCIWAIALYFALFAAFPLVQ